jgi:hypothetical protein
MPCRSDRRDAGRGLCLWHRFQRARSRGDASTRTRDAVEECVESLVSGAASAGRGPHTVPRPGGGADNHDEYLDKNQGDAKSGEDQ